MPQVAKLIKTERDREWCVCVCVNVLCVCLCVCVNVLCVFIRTNNLLYTNRHSHELHDPDMRRPMATPAHN